MNKILEDYLHKNIPISQAIGVHVEQASLDKVILSAPFANNINHKKTVFGGSLHAVATLACWSLLHLNLMNESKPVQIVIASSNVKYLVPLVSEFQAECLMPENAFWQYFLKSLHKKGKARIELSAKIYLEETLAVDYRATFVAIEPKQN